MLLQPMNKIAFALMVTSLEPCSGQVRRTLLLQQQCNHFDLSSSAQNYAPIGQDFFLKSFLVGNWCPNVELQISQCLNWKRYLFHQNETEASMLVPQGCGCSAAVQHSPNEFEVEGSIPAGCWAFFYFFFYLFQPQCCSSAGRASFKGPCLVQLYLQLYTAA